METVFQGQIQRLEQQLRRYTQAYERQRDLLYELQSKLHEQQTNASLPNDDAFRQRLADALRPPPLSPSQTAPMGDALTAAAADAAHRFVHSMRRLWIAFFAHMRGEVRGVLRDLDDVFTAFDANPREETLADLLEAHQRLRPALGTVFGEPFEKDVPNLAGMAMPPGNPLEKEAELVHSLTLCLAEAVAPLLTVVLHHPNANKHIPEKRPLNGNGNTNEGNESSEESLSGPREETIGLRAAIDAYRRHKSTLHGKQPMEENGGHPTRSTPIASHHIARGPSTVGTTPVKPIPNPRNINPHEEDVATEEVRTEFGVTEVDEEVYHDSNQSPYNPNPLEEEEEEELNRLCRPLHAPREEVWGSETPSPRSHSRPASQRAGSRNASARRPARRKNDSSQIEMVLYGDCGLELGSRSASRGTSHAPRRGSWAERTQRPSRPNDASSAINGKVEEEEEEGKGWRHGSHPTQSDSAAEEDLDRYEDPHLRLRHLQRLEEKAMFELTSTASRRRDKGNETRYYALNKRLARIRSAVIKTEREVYELDRIEKERQALRREREEYNRRRTRH